MTVTREKQNYNYPKPTSTTASDTESLHLGNISASDNESLNEEPLVTHYPLIYQSGLRISHNEELVNIKKCSGRRKIRRFQNRCVLNTLNEEDENENFIMEPYRSPFARLLEDPYALEYWNNFIEKSEEEQYKIVRAFTKKGRDYNDNVHNICTSKKHGNLSWKIRRTIKIKKNLQLETIKCMEDDLIEFFKTTPQGIYIKFPSTSFDRLLLHAVAQYHKLKSLSVLVEEIGKRSVEVHNTHSDWIPAECFLTDFIKEMKK